MIIPTASLPMRTAAGQVPSRDALRLQAALLDPRTATRPRPAIQRLLRAAWAWL